MIELVDLRRSLLCYLSIGRCMELLLIWPLVGAVIGYVAAGRRGFSPVLGVLVGALLGVFSFVLLIFGKNSAVRKCPKCDEWISAKAIVCKHCRSTISLT
jgi:hypothetical protein